MLLLNNPLLEIGGLIASFRINVIAKEETTDKSIPDILSQFKNKVKSIYFAKETVSDQQIIAQLPHDKRFCFDYPELKAALSIIFSPIVDKEIILSGLESCLTLKVDNLKRADRKWSQLNAELGYFTDRSDLLHLFLQLSDACRAMIVLVEQNNSPDYDMAYRYAYKLMALLDVVAHPGCDFQWIAKQTKSLIHALSANKEKPYYNARFNQVLLPKKSDVINMPLWRQFIAKHRESNMIAALSIFEHAPAIDLKLSIQGWTFPKTIAEAQTLMAICKYSRGAENIELAKICYAYNITEDGDACSFNKCLDYLASVARWPVKTDDKLPALIIKLAVDADLYYWVKLPSNDMRALTLGVMTQCCQSIGGESEQCVKDAVSLQNNGLYVLLKRYSSQDKDILPFAPDGAINYQAFEIVAQSYVWISKNGNLTLDSLECSIGRVPTSVAHTILTAFAEKVLEENTQIKFVTLGRGGGTPDDIGFSKTGILEIIGEGYHYGDSNDQFIIASSISCSVTSAQRAAINELLQPYPLSFRLSMEYLSYYLTDTENIADDLLLLLRQRPWLYYELDPQSVNSILSVTKSLKILDLLDLEIFVVNRVEYYANVLLGVVTQGQTESLPDIVNSWPIADRVLAVMEENQDGHNILHYIIDNSEVLIAMLKLLPATQFFKALTDIGEYNNSLLSNISESAPDVFLRVAELMSHMLVSLPQEDRLLILVETNTEGNNILHHLSDNPEILISLLKLLPPEQILSALTLASDVGTSLLEYIADNHIDSFIEILQLLTAKQLLDLPVRYKDIKEVDSYLHPVTQHSSIIFFKAQNPKTDSDDPVSVNKP